MSAQGTASACAARLRSPHRNQLRSWVTEGGGYAPGIPIRADKCGPLNAILPLPTDSEAFLWWRLRDEYPDGVIMTAVVIALSPAYRADRSPPPQDLDRLIVGLGHRIRYAMIDAMLAECFLRWPHPALCLCPLSPMPQRGSSICSLPTVSMSARPANTSIKSEGFRSVVPQACRPSRQRARAPPRRPAVNTEFAAARAGGHTKAKWIAMPPPRWPNARWRQPKGTLVQGTDRIRCPSDPSCPCTAQNELFFGRGGVDSFCQ
jgi:hypothetical protein